jgi:diguanylate cyclase (GGDEF)-like protein
MSASILIIDDSEEIRAQITKTLASYDLFARYYEAVDGLEGFRILLSSPVDLILCDLDMPRIDGFKFLDMMKSRPELQGIPVIILTGRENQEMKIAGLDQGASDCITKPFDPEELVARVKVHLKVKHLQDGLKRSNELLLELSKTDYLTGLFNRRYLMESLEKELKRAARKGGELSLILMDVDYFKLVNDGYGHLQGDVVLQKVALQIQKELRSYDIAARYGGEEFVAVLPDASLAEALSVAERMRASVEALRFSGELAPLRITISLGIAGCGHGECGSVDGFIKLADAALYRAKAGGRNRVECARGSSV